MNGLMVEERDLGGVRWSDFFLLPMSMTRDEEGPRRRHQAAEAQSITEKI